MIISNLPKQVNYSVITKIEQYDLNLKLFKPKKIIFSIPFLLNGEIINQKKYKTISHGTRFLNYSKYLKKNELKQFENEMYEFFGKTWMKDLGFNQVG